MTIIDWGWSVEEAAAKLPEVSEQARERIALRDKSYSLVRREVQPARWNGTTGSGAGSNPPDFRTQGRDETAVSQFTQTVYSGSTL